MPRVDPAPDLAVRLAPIEVTALDGTAVRLGPLWDQRPLLLVHLRHFGWMFCREHVAQLRDHTDEIDRRGVAVAAIGTGDLMYARDFAEDKRVNFPLYVDDAKASYKAVGTRKGSARNFVKPRLIASAARVTAQGHIQGKLGPAHMVLGATHVIRPDGSVPFAWINSDFDDNADFTEALASLGA